MSLAQILAGVDAWVVGGTVRDELLGRPIRDVDLAVVGDPEPPARTVAAAVRGPVFSLSEAFGAWRVIERSTARVYDFSPLQGETIEEDLGKRDFTANAIARPLAGGDLIDPFGGRADIMNLFDPRSSDALPHGGTFNANPLTMAAGLATLG